MESTLPQRIVCLTAETTEIVYKLGAGDRIVGVSGYSVRPPEARKKPRVGAFTGVRWEKIRALQPDLILGFSDLQADIAAALIKEGYHVLITNQRSLQQIEFAIRLLGGAIGCAAQAEEVIQEMRAELARVRASAAALRRRPRVLFEEWDDPLISGIRWVSEIIELAGGEDICAAESHHPKAAQRILDPAEALRRDPEVIVASWCGKKMQRRIIERRPGWHAVTAVRAGTIYEIKSADILQPGPGVLIGLRQLHDILVDAQSRL